MLLNISYDIFPTISPSFTECVESTFQIFKVLRPYPLILIFLHLFFFQNIDTLTLTLSFNRSLRTIPIFSQLCSICETNLHGMSSLDSNPSLLFIKLAQLPSELCRHLTEPRRTLLSYAVP